MNTAIDLRRSFAVAVLSALLCLALLGAGWHHYLQLEAQGVEWDKRRQQAQHYWTAAVAEQADFPALQAMWRELARRGVMGDWDGERQARWLAELRQRWPQLVWHFTGATPAPDKSQVMLGGMTLQLNLLHEGELLSLLEMLEHSPAGVFLLHGCSVRHQGEEALPLHVECEGAWVALPPRGSLP